MDHLCFLCLVFLNFFASAHCCNVVTCCKRADLWALVGDVYCMFVNFTCGQVWYLIVSFPDLCLLSCFHLQIREIRQFSECAKIHTMLCQFILDITRNSVLLHHAYTCVSISGPVHLRDEYLNVSSKGIKIPSLITISILLGTDRLCLCL